VSLRKLALKFGLAAAEFTVFVSTTAAQDRGPATPIQVAVVEVGTSIFFNKIEALRIMRASRMMISVSL